jgi:phospholipase C
VSWLVDQDLDDEHPSYGSVCRGENWTVGHLNHLMSSPVWNETAILFTIVKPARACRWTAR